MDCVLCKRSFNDKVSCTVKTVDIDGAPVGRVPFDGTGGVYYCRACRRYQRPDMIDRADAKTRCTRCGDSLECFCSTCRVPLAASGPGGGVGFRGVLRGDAYHHRKDRHACEEEICPKCGGKLARCGCAGDGWTINEGSGRVFRGWGRYRRLYKNRR